jgi:signal transduction histidine kinase
MTPDEITGDLAGTALHVVRSLLPGCSTAAGVVVGSSRSMRSVGSAGRHGTMLFQGEPLLNAYRAMSEHSAVEAAWQAANGPAGTLLSLPIRGRDGLPVGALQVAAGNEELCPAVRAALEAVTGLIADGLVQRKLNLDLRHSLNQLFLVYEVGRLFNLASSLDDVLRQVRDQLTGTLSFHHCCIMLLDDQHRLLPEAGIGIDRQWLEEARPEVKRTVAALVLESGVAEQVTDPIDLASMDTPTLDTGLPPEGVLCAPLRTRRGTIGVLELYSSTPYAFSKDEMFLLSVLAAELASAVENSQLYASLREKEGRLTVLAHKLVHSQEEERKRIARDMHDGLAQTLVSAFQYLQAHAYAVPEGTGRDSLDRGLAMVAECIDESRNVIFDLRPSTLDDFGLVLALKQYLERLEAEVGWKIDFHLAGPIGRLPSATETAVFRMVKEAVTNARKHARTARLRVRLSARGARLTIVVRDWGRGFDPREAMSRDSGQYGITGIRERVSLLNGTFQLSSKPGSGTLIRIMLPLE